MYILGQPVSSNSVLLGHPVPLSPVYIGTPCIFKSCLYWDNLYLQILFILGHPVPWNPVYIGTPCTLKSCLYWDTLYLKILFIWDTLYLKILFILGHPVPWNPVAFSSFALGLLADRSHAYSVVDPYYPLSDLNRFFSYSCINILALDFTSPWPLILLPYLSYIYLHYTFTF